MLCCWRLEGWWHPWTVCQRDCGFTPYCFLVFGAYRAASLFLCPAASDLIHNGSPVVNHAGGIPAALPAGGGGCYLLGHPHSWDGHRQQVHAKTAALTTGVLGGAASEPWPALWCVEVHTEGNWHFVQSTDRGLSSWELTCVEEEQLCCAPALISWWLSKVQPILRV